MAGVKLVGVSKAFGGTQILRGVDLDVRDGEFMVFVGPSGCGKSTLLRVIAGLEEVSEGELFIGGRVVNQVPPAERGIAMVFQSYALYPHMNLYDNMAFGLKLARMPGQQIDEAVRKAAKVLHIEHLLDRKPKDLSGGQRQRVAIGRAIVRQPEVFLFDEPLSNLDAELRVRMRYEFARLHEQLRTTMIYVTHDQVEAMTLADRIVVLSAGKVEQVGTPLELYEYPDNLFVAGFIGSPRMNFLSARCVKVGPEGLLAELAGGACLRAEVEVAGLTVGDTLTLGLRPEHFCLEPPGNALDVQVSFVESLGSSTHVYCSLKGVDETLSCELRDAVVPRSGSSLRLGVAPSRVYAFDAVGRALRRRVTNRQTH